MNKLTQLFVSVVLVSSLVSASLAQTSATGTATGRVIRPLALSWQGALSFGRIATPTSPGTGHVEIDISGIGPNAITSFGQYPYSGGTRTADGGAAVIPGGVTSPALFLVQGETSFFFTVSIPPTEVVVIPVHPTTNTVPQLALDNFHTNLTLGTPATATGAGTNTGNGGSAQLGATPIGTKYFAIGARLEVPYGAPAGDYTGAFNVHVFYN